MAKYRQLHEKFWTDPRVVDLTPLQKNLFAYAITGTEACHNTRLSGIYEITRGSLQMRLNTDISIIEEELDFFNKNRRMLMQYDGQNHMIFVKSFFKYNSGYSHQSAVQSLFEDFKETFKKAPEFWAEFGEIHRDKIRKLYLASEGKQAQFLETILNLKDNPSPTFEISMCDKLSENKKLQNSK